MKMGPLTANFWQAIIAREPTTRRPMVQEHAAALTAAAPNPYAQEAPLYPYPSEERAEVESYDRPGKGVNGETRN